MTRTVYKLYSRPLNHGKQRITHDAQHVINRLVRTKRLETSRQPGQAREADEDLHGPSGLVHGKRHDPTYASAEAAWSIQGLVRGARSAVLTGELFAGGAFFPQVPKLGC